MKTRRLRVTLKDGRVFEGYALPRTEFSSEDILVLKLGSGYNVGLSRKDIAKQEVLGEHSPSPPKPLPAGGRGPPVTLIGTGGTISSRVDYVTGGVEASMSAGEIVALVPEVAEEAELKFVDAMRKLSEDMVPSNWSKIAREAYRALKNSEGVVILHGTDTMHYSASAISFMIDTTKPIVFTGAQRSSDRPSTDATLNILASVRAAKGPVAESTICFHEGMGDSSAILIRGNRARKMHTSARAAFHSINYPPLARLGADGSVEELAEFFPRRDGEPELRAKVENRVAIVRTFPGSDPDVLRYYRDRGYRGVVIEGTGLGHVPVSPDGGKGWLPVVEEVLDDMVVAVTSQAIYGRTHRYVYTNLRKLSRLGVLMVEDMLTETAFTKLCWLLANFPREEVEKLMAQNLRGELSSRTLNNHI